MTEEEIDKLSIEIAVCMEVHAACGTTTRAKSDEIKDMLRPAIEQLRRERDALAEENKRLKEKLGDHFAVWTTYYPKSGVIEERIEPLQTPDRQETPETQPSGVDPEHHKE